MRELASWVDGFLEYTETLESPPIFRKWTGLFTVAAAMERKTWIVNGKGTLYPNVYTMLVGPPGAGKSLVTAVSREFLLTLEDHFISPTSVTRASLGDELRNAERKIVRPTEDPAVVTFNSLTVISDELGVFLSEYDGAFMSVLTNIYDNSVYSEARRSKDIRFEIPRPQLNFISGTTPSYLNGFLPEGAWDQGFLSRMMLVYSGATEPGDLFAMNNLNQQLFIKLAADLEQISNLYGEFRPEADMVEAITAWHRAKGPPRPDHPKLVHYNTRRTAHLLKLCMIVAASTGNDLRITLDHYVEALDILLSMEDSIPDIFKSMSRGGDSQIIADTWHFLYHAHIKEKRPIPEGRIITFLQERTPAHNIMRVLEIMCKTGILKEELIVGVGRAYAVKPLRPQV